MSLFYHTKWTEECHHPTIVVFVVVSSDVISISHPTIYIKKDRLAIIIYVILREWFFYTQDEKPVTYQLKIFESKVALTLIKHVSWRLTRPLNIAVGYLRLAKKILNVNSTWDSTRGVNIAWLKLNFSFTSCAVCIYLQIKICANISNSMYICTYSNEMQALLRNFWSAITRLLLAVSTASKNMRELISNICHLAHSYARNAFHESRMEKEF